MNSLLCYYKKSPHVKKENKRGSDMNVFEANKARKTINGNVILEELTLTISQGERIAITGENGSGKSTLLKLITGIYEKTAGEVQRAPLETGYVPEHFPETIKLKLQEYLILVGKISGKSKHELTNEITEYAKRFNVTEFLHTPLKNCSKGTKQKAGIIQALLKEPDVLLMDEPLTGLDEQAQTELLTQLHSLEKKITVIFTAHESYLIDAFAERILQIKNGRLVYDSTKLNQEKGRIIKTTVPTRACISAIQAMSIKWHGESLVELTVSANESDHVLTLLLKQGCSIIELSEKR